MSRLNRGGPLEEAGSLPETGAGRQDRRHLLVSRLAASATVAAVAFFCYYSTLLPGQDLGDTASFQATAGSLILTPRQGYPLWYATANPFVWWIAADAARATNLASAFFAALAAGLLTWVTADIAGSLAGGLFAGLLIATSYTFWTQAIIAEVYALHLFMFGACLAALLAWARRPSMARLAVFFFLYAVGFGNHLSMVLLLPGFALFLLLFAPGGPFAMLRPRVLLLAALMAALGAAQYLWNLSFLWTIPDWQGGLRTMLSAFWFDVTKADWRASMVFGVAHQAFADRAAMYWFDLRQQFGVAGIGAALAGAAALLVARPRLACAVLLLYAVNFVFAFTYNVGDTHVFYLPSHYAVALVAGCGAALLVRAAGSRAGGTRAVVPVAILLLLYPAWRGLDTWPAVDRSSDWRPTAFFDRLTKGLSGEREIFAADLNWQLHNGLDYYAKYTRPDLAVFDADDTLLYFPFLADSNQSIGRGIALTPMAAGLVASAYGDLYDLRPDARVAVEPLARRVAATAPGTRYVLTLLDPYPDMPLDAADFSRVVAQLTGGTVTLPVDRYYNVLAGRAGAVPVLRLSTRRPFRASAELGGLRLDVRMDAWMPADTIRRAGFGQVIVNHRHVMTMDRGVSFVAIGADGAAMHTEYAAGLFAPETRYALREPGAPRAAAAGDAGTIAQQPAGSGPR